jgi:hypothetical protein
MSSVASNQVIDVKVKKPRAPKKDKTTSASESTTATDLIPPPTTAVTETTAAVTESAPTSETKTKKPRATKKDKNTTEVSATETETDVAVDSETDAKTKKPRAPTLPAKFAKFIKFNFFFINQMNDIDQDTKDAYLNTFAVFAPVEQQTQIVTDFLLTQKTVNKDYRSALSAQKKAIAKANKPQRRSKKSVQVDFQNNLVNQLIESANLPSNESNESTETNEKEKKPRGRKPKNNENNDATSSDSAKETKEKKPRGRKPKQTETVTATATTTVANDASASASTENQDDEDTEVSRFVHGGKSFLRDRENNLYDELSHEPVGEYDPANDSVLLL